ncbi:MAG: hypothetical protein E7400_03795 [Ruminococcaceae bacterium]|nr:hypothetical protein [Oscillospiraceae bacterium]
MIFSKIKCRLTCISLVLCLLATLMPVSAFAETSDIGRPVFIYTNFDHEENELNEAPWGWGLSGNAKSNTHVVECANNDGSANKAVKLTGHANSGSFMGYSAFHLPATEDFVTSFRFRTTDTTGKLGVVVVHGEVNQNSAEYCMNGTLYHFLNITDSITVTAQGSPVVYTGIEKNQWYDVACHFHVSTNTLDVYVNGKKVGRNITMGQDVNYFNGMRFAHSTEEGADWFIDDYRAYISDEVLADAVFAQHWNKYESSELNPPARWERGREYEYNRLLYYMLYDEFVMMIGGQRFYKDNQFYQLPSPVTQDENGRIIVPLRAFAESFGATVTWEAGETTVSWNGKNLRFVDGDQSYYVNGKPARLYLPITVKNGISYIQLDVLTAFFGVEYELQDTLISFTGEVVCPYLYSPKNTGSNAHGPLPGMQKLMEEHITRVLSFGRPKAADLKDAFYENNPDLSHPRLMISDWSYFTEGMEKEAQFAAGVQAILRSADNLLDDAPVYYDVQDNDGLRGTFPQKIYDRARTFAFAYNITKDVKYKERLWQEVEAIKEFPDLNPNHPLDIGNSAHGLAFMYDWIDDWTETERQTIEEIIVKHVFPVCDVIYSSTTPLGGQTASGNQIRSTMTAGGSNQHIIIQAGFLACAIALFEKYPDYCADLAEAIYCCNELSFMDFAPDGAWAEGVSYWKYTCETLPILINHFQQGFGSDLGFLSAPGLNKTAYFPISMKSSGGTYELGDDLAGSVFHASQMFFAKFFEDYALAKYYKENQPAPGLVPLVNWVWDEEIEAAGAESVQLTKDNIFRGFETVTMRTGMGSADTTVIFHGSANNDSHGHIDAGSFQFHMLGEQWAEDIEGENYNLGSYGKYQSDNIWRPDTSTMGFYRGNAEGHNVVLANYGEVKSGVLSTARGDIERYSFTDTGAYTIMKLTGTNPNVSCAVRGVMLNRITGDLIIQDEYSAKNSTDFWWWIHTTADIDISEDGKSAILTKNNKRIWAEIISPGNETFCEIKPEPLSKQFQEYSAVTTPPLETPMGYMKDGSGNINPEETGMTKLAVRSRDTDKFTLSVVFKPMGTEDVPANIPEYKSMAQWKLDDDAEFAQLEGVTINGAPMELSEGIYSYNIDVKTELESIPVLAASAPEGYDVSIMNAESIPGVTTVVMTNEEDEIAAMYYFTVTPLNNTSTFVSDKQLPVTKFWASSEPEAANPVKNLFDGDLSTKFATNENGGTVTIDFGETVTFHEIQMAFQQGAVRQEYFKIEYSTDGVNWTEAYNGGSSGKSTEREKFAMNDVEGRYIRLTFYGNSNNGAWVSVTEFCALTN